MVGKEYKAYLYCHGQVHLVFPFFCFLFYGNFYGYDGAEVVQGHLAEDLKCNVLREPGMEVYGSDSMLPVTERGFLAQRR